ncbi:NAD(P)H-dependent flavin oxidoreductase [Alkalihalobacterium alkalinitrilicum]|uniref:NAD(P)H-dependent flavin oxidoreductase n=1 Tax=Alkalihalobacterium alkalinitrilicum TaxID=427920 RepID=UPI001EE3CD0D|nr:nitronate monooxygenase [Alkalihalobacterium alkalinitrilicum]
MNRICEMLQIEVPIIEGGLAYVGNGLLAAAVSNGGGFGQVGSAGRSPENFENEILLAREATTKPFGVNIPISQHTDFTPYLEIIKKHKDLITAVSLGAGNPKNLIPFIKEHGLKVLVLTSTAFHSAKAEALGADIIVCEGYEAGGSNGPSELTTFTLVPQVKRVVSIPVVAAGGIVDGRSMAAAMILGADGVQLGTRFVATKECEAHDHFKAAILEADNDSTTIMTRMLKGPLRVLKNEYANKVQEMEKKNPTVEHILPMVRGTYNKLAMFDGDIQSGFMSCGQVASLIDELESAETIVKQMSNEASQLLTTSFRNFSECK